MTASTGSCASRYSQPSWVHWSDASDRSLSLAEAKTGHLGYLPKERKEVRDEAGLNTSPLVAQDGFRHQPGRDDLRACRPQSQRGTRQRQKRARERAEQGLDALPGDW